MVSSSLVTRLDAMRTVARHPGQAVGSMIALPALTERGVGAWAGTLLPTVGLSLVTGGGAAALRAASAATAGARVAEAAEALEAAGTAAARLSAAPLWTPAPGGRLAAAPPPVRRVGVRAAESALRRPVIAVQRGAIRSRVVLDARTLSRSSSAPSRRAAVARLSASLDEAWTGTPLPISSRCGPDDGTGAACSPNALTKRDDARLVLFGPSPPGDAPSSSRLAPVR